MTKNAAFPRGEGLRFFVMVWKKREAVCVFFFWSENKARETPKNAKKRKKTPLFLKKIPEKEEFCIDIGYLI